MLGNEKNGQRAMADYPCRHYGDGLVGFVGFDVRHVADDVCAHDLNAWRCLFSIRPAAVLGSRVGWDRLVGCGGVLAVVLLVNEFCI